MSIEQDLFDRLRNNANVSGVVSSRIYPVKLPQAWTLPAITYQRISTPRAHIMSGLSGRARPRFQIDCWADDYGTVKDLAIKVGGCLDGFKGDLNTESNVGGIILDSERDIYEDEIDVYRVLMEFIIPHFET